LIRDRRVTGVRPDPIESFYDRHPYPPPVAELGPVERRLGDERSSRAAHHRIWPARPVESLRSVLVAGCGTSQAVRHALRHPAARVVGIDVSAESLEHTRALAARHDVPNLELHRIPIEAVDRLGERFDHVVCTGVLHHLADPALGLRRLREVLAPGGAVTLMVYARYGRTGVYLFHYYCRRLGVDASPDDLADLVATLREIPLGHPLSRLLRDSRDFADDDALADALCNPRDRAYSVPELLELVDGAGLRFGRWERQAPYLPACGAISETPHAARIAALPAAEQYALVELFRGTMTRHTAIAFADDDPTSGVLDFSDPAVGRWVPVLEPTAIAVEDRLPPGAAAALINRAHTDTDLVLFADRRRHEIFRSIDGDRTIGQLGPDAGAFVERLWRHDLVVLDTTAAGGAR
jgi:SAM-dependent methyltransferase